MKAAAFLLLAAALLATAVPAVRAQLPGALPGALAGVRVDADSLTYDHSNSVISTSGKVRIEHGDTELTADRVTIYRLTSIAQAEGNVRLRRSDILWEGERLTYNLETREMTTDRFAAAFPPYHVWAEAGAKGTGMTYTLRNATFSTCREPLESLHYHLWARELTIVPDSHLAAKHVVTFAGPVPVFYLPVMKRSLEEDVFGVQLQPGYRSRMGGYLLSGLSYKFSDAFEATTLLDYRSERGLAGGEELDWKSAGGEGKLHAYLLDDTGVENDDNDYPSNRVPDSARYRLRLKHAEDLGDGWSFMGEANKLSDEFTLEDFYRRDYRNSPEPKNFLQLGHIQDDSALSVLGKFRVDDFYTTVSRLPEVRHEIFLTPLADSGWYYQGYNDAVWLMRQPADYLEDAEDQSLLRFDSSQFATYPTSVGPFHLVPRAGVRATWYSETRDTVVWTREGTVSNTLADGTVVATNGTISTTYEREGGAQLRPLFEIGSEASFKAFKRWDAGAGEGRVPYRHIAEPYANYTLRPNLLDQDVEDFYQFDEVDQYSSEHAFRLGMRNMIQFKRDGRIYELVDVDVYSTYYMESQLEEEGIGPLNLKLESRPSDMVYLRGDAEFDLQDGEMELYNLRGQLAPHPQWRLTGEYRYRLDLSELVSATIKYMPSSEWAFSVYARYDAEGSRVEEHAWALERVLDCMGYRIGIAHEPGYTMADGRERDDDFGIQVELWLTAFPGSRWGAGPRR